MYGLSNLDASECWCTMAAIQVCIYIKSLLTYPFLSYITHVFENMSPVGNIIF